MPSWMRVEPAEDPSKRAYTGYGIPPAEWDVSTCMGEVSEVLPCRVAWVQVQPGLLGAARG